MKGYGKLEKTLSILGFLNLIAIAVMTAVHVFEPIEWVVFFMQVVTFGCFVVCKKYANTHQRDPQSDYEREFSNILSLETYEKSHEQKRHYQIALALIEIGEREQAVSYIETIIKEIV